MKIFNSRKASLKNMSFLIVVFVVAIIIGSVGTDIVNVVRSTQTINASDYNTSTKGLDGFKTIGGWYEPLGLVIAASVVIGVLVTYLMRGG